MTVRRFEGVRRKREPSKTAGDRCGAYREARKRFTATESPNASAEISIRQPAQMVQPEQVSPWNGHQVGLERGRRIERKTDPFIA
jgi:hypothetical protein